MNKNQIQTSIFTEKQKEIIEKLDKFIIELKEGLPNGNELIEIEYYDKLDLDGKKLVNSDFYIVTTQDKNANKVNVEIYAINSQNKIGRLGENGNFEFFDKAIKDLTLDKKDLKERNAQNLKGKDEKVKPDEIKENLKNKEKNKSNKIEKDLKTEAGEDLEISYYREIKDNEMQRAFPDKFKGAEEIGMAYSKKLNQFICVVKKNGKFERAKGIEPAKPTMRTVISMNEDGSKIARKTPHALLKTDDENKELSITIGQYGYIETGIVDRTPCNERVEHPVREGGEPTTGRTEKNIRDKFNTGGKYVKDKLAHKFKENEQDGLKQQNLECITGNEEIRLEDGTITTWKKEAEKAKLSVESFKKEFDKAKGETVDEKLENAHKEIEAQTGAPTRLRLTQ